MRHTTTTTGILFLLLSLLYSFAGNASTHSRLSVYPYTPTGGLHPNDVYSVSVRVSGSDEWQHVPVWNCKVDMHHRSTAAFAQFDMEGTVEVRVKLEQPAVMAADTLPPMLRPTARGIDYALNDRGTEMLFTLCEPGIFQCGIRG